MNIKHAYIFIGGIPIMKKFISLSLSLVICKITGEALSSVKGGYNHE